LLCLCAFLVAESSGQFYDGSNLTFGKNRIQYKELIWQSYRLSENDVYFYEGGKELATHVAQVVPRYMKEAENRLDYVVQDRIQFIVYNTHTDFKQSNIGLVDPASAEDIGGTARILGKKVFLFFNGDYTSFDKQIMAGISRLMINEMMYGGDLKDAIKNAALLNFPNWYTEGLVSHLGNGWSVEIEERVRDGILSGRYEKFGHLERTEAIYAGHSVWKYISDVYGESVIPNVLYMAKVSRSIENGFLFVLGLPLEDMLREHDLYYSRIFEQQSMARQAVNIPQAYVKTKKGHDYSQFRISPDGKQAAFISNILGQYRIWLYELDEHHRDAVARYKEYVKEKAIYDKGEEKKRRQNPDYVGRAYKPYKPKYSKAKRIYKAEHKLDRIVDESYPILEWNPRGNELSFITEKKGDLWLNTYSIEKKKSFKRELFGLQKVLSFDYSRDGKRMVMSAVSNGMTDIYLYHLLGNRQERLTWDDFDDLEPRFAFKDSKVVFTSNRMDDTLRSNYHSPILPKYTDIFALELSNRTAPLERLSSTPEINEHSPYQYDSLRYTYLSDRGGMDNRYIATYDSTIARVDTTIHYRYFTTEQQLTDMRRAPLEYEVNPRRSKYGLLKFIDGRYSFFFDDLGEIESIGKVSTPSETGKSYDGPGSISVDSPDVVIYSKEKKASENGVDITDYQFSNERKGEIDEAPNTVVVIEDFESLSDKRKATGDSLIVDLPKPRNYKLNFVNDKLIIRLSNSYNNQFYQSLAYGSANLSPGLRIPLKAGFSDLFEDRRLIATVLLDPQVRDQTYIARYDNYLKRLDKTLVFSRQALSSLRNDQLPSTRIITNTARYRVSWPFSEVLSLRGDILLNHEKLSFLSTNDLSLNLPDINSIDGGGKAELVFDNTLNKGLNLFNGSRMKAWAEYYHNYNIETEELPSFGVIGFDARHYQKIHREMIAAFRIAGNTTFGDQKLLTYLGGVDNWMIPSPETDDTPVDFQTQNYAYQALLAPLRGFFRNARNGTSAAVANAEIRWPIARYFSNTPVKSDFLQNFQVVGFSDVGTAWTGSGPYADDNGFNTLNVTGTNSSVDITLRNQEDPILFGYGFGLRARMLGYFIRADWAWGIIDGQTQPREFYISLNLDF